MATEIDEENIVRFGGLAERRKGCENLGFAGVFIHEDRHMFWPKPITFDKHALQRFDVVQGTEELRRAATVRRILALLVIHPNQYRMPLRSPNGHQPEEHHKS
jgi:hypothetical protein